jgi:hypothetical protein
MEEEINIPALMDSIVGIDQALQEEITELKNEFLKANKDFINQQLTKPEYQEALTQEQKEQLQVALDRIDTTLR